MTEPPNDPRPGDFDAGVADLRPEDVSVAQPDERREVVLQVMVRGDAARALDQIARRRGEEPAAVVADLIRSASDEAE